MRMRLAVVIVVLGMTAGVVAQPKAKDPMPDRFKLLVKYIDNHPAEIARTMFKKDMTIGKLRTALRRRTQAEHKTRISERLNDIDATKLNVDAQDALTRLKAALSTEDTE